MSWFERLYRYCDDSKKVLGFTFALGTLFVLLHAFFCINIYDDVANYYVPMARDIGNCQWQ